jgi:phage minor structural protein
VKDKNLNELGIIENAYNTPIERTVNEVWQFSFSVPKDDPKNVLCTHMNYIDVCGASRRYYGLYRIMPTETRISASDNSITYQCEHVVSTLLDDVIDGYLQLSGMSTAQSLQALLDLQETANWVLGEVDFPNTYEYSFENENGLLAPILSIPKAFNEAYEFTYDTTSYPWVLNLKTASNTVKSEIRWGKDMEDFNKASDPTEIVNYIIPKGVGEGRNQLTIARANGGLNYIKDDVSIAQWGKRSYIWIDTSIEDSATLKARAQALLEEKKSPKISFSVGAADLSILEEYKAERRLLNTVTRIVVGEEEYAARIISEKIADITKEYDVEYVINNKITDIATTSADLERKVSVSTAYSQGATNIYSFTYQDNCDQNVPAHISFYVDNDVVNVNTCELTFETKKYRGYNEVSNVYDPSSGTTDLADGPGTHSHGFGVPSHKHFVTPGVVEYEINVTNLSILVDGNAVPGTAVNMDRLNIIPYLSKTGGVINRGKHEIDILPDNPARIEANVILRVFIQSRLGGNY